MLSQGELLCQDGMLRSKMMNEGGTKSCAKQEFVYRHNCLIGKGKKATFVTCHPPVCICIKMSINTHTHIYMYTYNYIQLYKSILYGVTNPIFWLCQLFNKSMTYSVTRYVPFVPFSVAVQQRNVWRTFVKVTEKL